MLSLSEYFDKHGHGFMMASIKDDFTAFESIKKKTWPRYKKTWVEFKDEVIFLAVLLFFLTALVLLRKNNSTAKMN